MPDPSMVRREKGLIVSTLHQLLMIDLVRFFVAAVRYVYFVYLRRALKTYDLNLGVEKIAPNTISHNLTGLRDLAVNRSLALVRPLSIIESLSTDARVLTIGPRTEGEILNLMAHGFKSSNITGLDLISYSPWIQLGDMHKMKFADNQFDAVILGWVLGYSSDPAGAAKEIIRVTKPGGVIAVGNEYNPMTSEEIVKDLGYLPGHTKRIESTKQTLEYFGDSVDHVYYHHSPIASRKHLQGAMCTIFSIKK